GWARQQVDRDRAVDAAAIDHMGAIAPTDRTGGRVQRGCPTSYFLEMSNIIFLFLLPSSFCYQKSPAINFYSKG
ncbi:MAG: hypothetical protein SWX82_29410, partial [Cyanobacteriota bacterium]|nr:hypothetical protein [Cyanobacteriota bacterium]